MPSKKTDKNNSIRIIFIKIIIKINVNNIYIKNTYFITRNTKLPESSLKQNIFPSAQKALKSSLNILLVTNQSRIIFNAAREPLTASSHILQVLYYSGQYTIKNGYSEATLSYILEFCIDQEQNQIQKTSINCFMTHFSSHKAFRDKFQY